jgi:TolB-like protein
MKLHLTELSRRGVFKVLAAYAVAAWVLIEVVSVITPAFLLPGWTVAVITTLLVLGAFPALVLAWRYDITREGIKRDTSEVSSEVDHMARRISVVIVLGLVAAVAVLWVHYFNVQSATKLAATFEAHRGAPLVAEDGRIRSIAVLPFDDYSLEGRHSLLADGIADSILHTLAQNKDLLVTARSSSFYFRDKQASAAEIGRILGVEALVEGSVQIADEMLRVTTQLVRTSDQAQLWSNVYAGPLEDIFSIQDTISRSVQELIFMGAESFSTQSREPNHPSLEAYELLLEARNLLDSFTLEATEQAIRSLRLATQLNPDYADAYAQLGKALRRKLVFLLQDHRRSSSESQDLILEIDSVLTRVFELDPNNVIAILIRGEFAKRGYKGRSEALRQALEIAPNDPHTLNEAGGDAAFFLDFSSYRNYAKRAKAVNPADQQTLWQYLFAFCGREPLSEVVTSHLKNYAAKTSIAALQLRGYAAECDQDYVDAIDLTLKEARLSPEASPAVRALGTLAALGHIGALRSVDAAHRVVPGGGISFSYALTDYTLYFKESLDDRVDTYRWLVRVPFGNPYFDIARFAQAQLLTGDLDGAQESLEQGQAIWERYFDGEPEITLRTVAIYADQAWLMFQNGETGEATALAQRLAKVLEDRGLLQWSGSRGDLGALPVMVMLLNDMDEQALEWLQDAERDAWIFFQALLTSPVFEQFRANPEVADILARLIDQRSAVLARVMETGLPEVLDPSLLLAAIRERVPALSDFDAGMSATASGELDVAARHFLRALDVQSNDNKIVRDVAWWAASHGKLQEAIELAEFMVRRWPQEYQSHYSLGRFNYFASNWEASINSLHNADALAPDKEAGFWKGMALLKGGDAAAALEVIEQIPDESLRLAGSAIVLHALSRATDAAEALTKLMTQSNKQYLSYVLAYRGDADRVFEAFRDIRLLRESISSLPAHIEPLYTNLYDDPRWHPYLESIGQAPSQLEVIEFSVRLPE